MTDQKEFGEEEGCMLALCTLMGIVIIIGAMVWGLLQAWGIK